MSTLDGIVLKACDRRVLTRFLGLALLAAGLARAQDSPSIPRPQGQPGSISNLEEQDSPEADLANAGPSVFGQAKSVLAQRDGKLIDLRFYGEITGVYDSALVPATSPANGQPAAVPDYGLESGAGIIASRRWRHARLSLEYKEKFRQYARDVTFNGSDQFLDLVYEQLLRRHLMLRVKQIAGTSTVANGEFSYLALANTDAFAVPANELFDSRTYYAESRVDALWQTNSRLTFELGGDGFVVRRQYSGLAGLNGYSTRAGVAYRLTQRQTIGATFQHTSFDFQRVFGDARLQTATVAYAVALSKTTDFRLQLGGTRVSSSGLTQVTLDPSVAAVLGQSTAIVTFSGLQYAPIADVRLVRRFAHSSLSFALTRDISPGNGVYLTSRRTAGSAGYSFAGARRWTGALNAGYSRLSSLASNLPPYTNFQAGAGITYRLAGEAYAELRYDYRHYSTQDLSLKMDSNRVSLGVAFSPGAAPLAIW